MCRLKCEEMLSSLCKFKFISANLEQWKRIGISVSWIFHTKWPEWPVIRIRSGHISGVLVTGASGFVGIHCVKQLLKENYTVRGTVRDLNNHFKIDPLKQLEGAAERLELVEADLESDQGWSQFVLSSSFFANFFVFWILDFLAVFFALSFTVRGILLLHSKTSFSDTLKWESCVLERQLIVSMLCI